LQVINERSARTRALVGVTTERDIRKWSGSDEVRDLLDINNKMCVDLSDLAQRTPNTHGPHFSLSLLPPSLSLWPLSLS
jgi:hypothetical protein